MKRKFIITINEMYELIVSNCEKNVDENKNEVIDSGPVFGAINQQTANHELELVILVRRNQFIITNSIL